MLGMKGPGKAKLLSRIIIIIIIIITKIYIAHYRIAINALTVSVRSITSSSVVVDET